MSTTWRAGAQAEQRDLRLSQLRDLLLAQRGITEHQRDNFFEPSYARDIHNPYLMSGMDAAVAAIKASVSRGERVVVYGDYDADGITSLAVLVQVLTSLGGNVSPFLPHRLDHGYGLNMDVLKKLAVDTDLLITVDCGVTGKEEIAWLRREGVQVIVTDHHRPPEELPPALAVLHPRHPAGEYPCGYLSGVGVAWKLAQALLDDETEHKRLLDLVCLGTVADMVPLRGENRAIVSFGLRLLRRSQRPGLKLLVQSAQRGEDELDSDVISYRLAPLLNAAGRLDHGQPALDLLLAGDEHSARAALEQLEKYNRRRSSRSVQIQREAEEALTETAPLLFVSSDKWEAGLVGLVAGKLCDKFARPAVVVGGGNGCAVGSARAPGGVNIFDILSAQKKHLLNFGGHESAAGFSLAYDKVDAFRRSLSGMAREIGRQREYKEEEADAVIGSHLLNWDMAEMLEKFAPYGEGNDRPSFICRRVEMAGWRAVGKTEEHAKFTFRLEDEPLDGIGFGLARREELRSLRRGQTVDVLFNLEVNEFGGRRSLQLRVKDIAPAGKVKIVTGSR